MPIEQKTESTNVKGHEKPATSNLLELAELDPAKTAARVYAMWEAQDHAERRRHQFRQRNKLWVKGYPGVAVVPTTQDMGDYRLDIGYGLADMKPVGSRLATLIRRLAAHQYVDQPVPQVEPSQDAPDAENAAEFGERLLQEDGGLTGTNDIARFMAASQRSSVVASAFTYFWVDPFGNGWKPMQIMAHPMAQTVADATIDPATGQPADENTLVMRYVGESPVGEDGQAVDEHAPLTNVPADAAKQWLPKVCPEDVSVYQVRPIPATARDIDHAAGVMVLLPWTLGQMKAEYPEIADLDAEALKALVDWKPLAARWALPWYLHNKGVKLPQGPDGEPNDDEIVWSLAWYQKSGPSYPEGAYILTAAAKYVLYAGKWSATVQTPDGETPFLLDLPVAQCQSLTDEEQPDFYGRALVDDLGPYDALSIQILDGAITHSQRFLYPHVFLPNGTTIQPEQLANRGIAPILYNGAGGGLPVVEEVPQFDPTSVSLLEFARNGLDDTLGLLQPAQGVQTPNVNSAKQGAQLIQQSYANIATLVQNSKRYITRYWKLKLQLWRAFCTIPQRVRFVGDDGAYKERDWTGDDLAGATAVTLKVGSFTQMTPEQKEQYVQSLMVPSAPNAPPILDWEEGQRLLSSNMSARIGRTDNPHRLRVGRQIATWREGPPDGWDEAQAAFQQAQQHAQQVTQSMTQEAQSRGIPPEMAMPRIEQAGQMAMGGMEPPFTPFDELPPDIEPPVAKMRHAELSRVIASTDFLKWPPAWQQLIVDAYQKARLAAGLLLPAEQAEQQAQQMAQQQDAERQSADDDHARTLEREAAKQPPHPLAA